MAQDYLSPRQIIRILKFLESRIPFNYDGDYIPKLQQATEDINLINDEVRNMMVYAGLFTYTPSCRWVDLDKGVAANIELNGATSGIVKINIDNNLKNDIDGLLATLAHEICHKRLEDSFINNALRSEGGNMKTIEQYTDLCTIFLGFGSLIVKGCKKLVYENSNLVNRLLGYLDYQNYVQAYNIVRIVRGNLNDLKLIDTTGDYFLEEALTEWVNTSDKRILLKNAFKSSSYEIAEFYRNIAMCQQMFEAVKQKENIVLEKLNQVYFDENVLGDRNCTMPRRPIMAFAAIYEKSTNTDAEYLDSVNENIKKFLAIIDDEIGYYDNDEFKYQGIICPFCGATAQQSNIDGKHEIFKCGRCRKYFLIDRRHVDFKGINREIYIPSTEITNAREEAYQKGKSNGLQIGLQEEQNRANEEIENLKAIHAKQLIDKYNRGIEVGSRKLRNEFLHEIPVWLRWLVTLVLKNKSSINEKSV